MNKKWIIAQKGYNPIRNCQHPVDEHLTCGDYGRALLLIRQDGTGYERWVCANHAQQDYQIVGDWAETWYKTFEIITNHG